MGITIENLQVDDLHANPNNPRKQVGDVEEPRQTTQLETGGRLSRLLGVQHSRDSGDGDGLEHHTLMQAAIGDVAKARGMGQIAEAALGGRLVIQTA